jgi:hypothetical protein
VPARRAEEAQLEVENGKRSSAQLVFRAIIEPLEEVQGHHLNGWGREQCEHAFQASPEGFERIARAALERAATSPLGLLCRMVEKGDHLLDLSAREKQKKRTGWRFVRGDGGQSGTYVADPEGVDRLPPGYSGAA